LNKLACPKFFDIIGPQKGVIQVRKHNTQSQIRQGDLLFVKVDSLTLEGKEDNEGIIQRGETTGHAHRICWEDLQQKRGTVLHMAEPVQIEVDGIENALTISHVVKSKGNLRVEHQDHKTITLSKGTYAVVRQRELHLNEFRTVMD
jgi:hypothetical protein